MPNPFLKTIVLTAIRALLGNSVDAPIGFAPNLIGNSNQNFRKRVSSMLLLEKDPLSQPPFSHRTHFSIKPPEWLFISDSRSNKINISVVLTLDVPTGFLSRGSEISASPTVVLNWGNLVPRGHLIISGDILGC